MVEPLGERQFVGLHLQMQAIGRVAWHIEAFQDVERDQHDQSLGYGWLFHDGPATIGRLERVEHVGSMLRQVAAGKRAAGSLRSGQDRFRDGAVIEGGGALGPDGPQGPGKVGLAEVEPGARWPAVRKKDRPGLGKLRPGGGHRRIAACLPRGQWKTRLGVGDRVGQQLAERPRAKSRKRDLPGVDDARHSGRQPARLGNLA